MSGRHARRVRLMLAALRSRLAPALGRAFMPFRADTPLTARDRRVVAVCWGVAGMVFACVWTAALALLMPGFSGGRALTAAILLILGAGAFFAAAGYALVGLGQMLLTRQRGRPPRPPSAPPPHGAS